MAGREVGERLKWREEILAGETNGGKTRGGWRPNAVLHPLVKVAAACSMMDDGHARARCERDLARNEAAPSLYPLPSGGMVGGSVK